jgi:hypothetical protein
MQLSKNFSLEEMTKSQTAIRFSMDNTPDAECIEAMKALCQKVLEIIRENLGEVQVNSGYRSPEVNKAIGGMPTSQHCRGEAADIEVPGVANVDLAKWISAKCDFDQLILECYTSGEPESGWVHVSYKPTGNRKIILTSHVARGRMQYQTGLHP